MWPVLLLKRSTLVVFIVHSKVVSFEEKNLFFLSVTVLNAILKFLILLTREELIVCLERQKWSKLKAV